MNNTMKIQITWAIAALLGLLIGYLLVVKTMFWFLLVLIIGFMAINYTPTFSKKWILSVKNVIFYGSSLGFVGGLLLGGFVRLINV